MCAGENGREVNVEREAGHLSARTEVVLHAPCGVAAVAVGGVEEASVENTARASTQSSARRLFARLLCAVRFGLVGSTRRALMEQLSRGARGLALLLLVGSLGCMRPAVLTLRNPTNLSEATTQSHVTVGGQPRVFRLDWLATLPEGYEKWGADDPNFDYYLVQFSAGGHYLDWPIRQRTFQVQFGLNSGGVDGATAWVPNVKESVIGFPTVVGAFPKSELRELGRVSFGVNGELGLAGRVDVGVNAGTGTCVEEKDGECVRRAIYTSQGIAIGAGGVARLETTAALAFKKEWKLEEPVMTQSGVGTSGASWVDRSGIFNGDSVYSVILRVPQQAFAEDTKQAESMRKDLARLAATASAYFTALHAEPVHQLSQQLIDVCGMGPTSEAGVAARNYSRLVNAMLYLGAHDEENSATPSAFSATVTAAEAALTAAEKAATRAHEDQQAQTKKVAAAANALAEERDPQKKKVLTEDLAAQKTEQTAVEARYQARLVERQGAARAVDRLRSAVAYEKSSPWASMGLSCAASTTPCATNLAVLSRVQTILVKPEEFGLDKDLANFTGSFKYAFPDEDKTITFARYDTLYDHLKVEARRSYRETHEALVRETCSRPTEAVRLYRQLLVILSRQNETLERRIKSESTEAEKSLAVNRSLADSYAKASALQGFREVLAATLTRTSAFPLECLRVRVAAHRAELNGGQWTRWPEGEGEFAGGQVLFGTTRRIEGSLTLAKPKPAFIPPKIPTRVWVSSNLPAARAAFVPVDDKGVAIGEPRFVTGLAGSAELSAGKWKVTVYPVSASDGKSMQYPTVVLPDGTKKTMTEVTVVRGLDLELEANEQQRHLTFEVLYTQPEPQAVEAKVKD